MAEQQRRIAAPDVFANLACAQRPSGFHQYHAASIGEAGLPLAASVIHQFQQISVHGALAKHAGEAQDRLSDGADPFHDLGTLAYELLQFFMSGLHDLLEMRVAVEVSVVARCRTANNQKTIHTNFCSQRLYTNNYEAHPPIVPSTAL